MGKHFKNCKGQLSIDLMFVVLIAILFTYSFLNVVGVFEKQNIELSIEAQLQNISELSARNLSTVAMLPASSEFSFTTPLIIDANKHGLQDCSIAITPNSITASYTTPNGLLSRTSLASLPVGVYASVQCGEIKVEKSSSGIRIFNS